MSAAPDRAASVGLVVALPAEARSLGVRGAHAGDCLRWRDGWVAVSGLGPHNAMRAAEQLVGHGVTRLANWGVAGALDSGLEPGDIVIPERVVYAVDDDGYPTDPAGSGQLADALAARLRVRRGLLWSTHQAIATGTRKREIAERSHALAVEMEAAPVAAVAQRESLPFVALKVICDTAARDLPRGIAATLDQSQEGMSLRMLVAIALGGPTAWRATRGLARDYARARRALATAAQLADPVAIRT